MRVFCTPPPTQLTQPPTRPPTRPPPHSHHTTTNTFTATTTPYSISTIAVKTRHYVVPAGIIGESGKITDTYGAVISPNSEYGLILPLFEKPTTPADAKNALLSAKVQIDDDEGEQVIHGKRLVEALTINARLESHARIIFGLVGNLLEEGLLQALC